MADCELLAALRSIWAEVLELSVAQVRPNSHFLQLGGDSLHWTRMTLRVQDLWGLELPAQPGPTFATPTELAEYCRRRLAHAERKVTPSTSVTAQENAGFPATGMQQGLWFAEQLAGSGNLYQSAVILHFTGHLDVVRLRRAFRQLLQEVPVLRANFCMDGTSRRHWASYRPLESPQDEALVPCRTLEPDALAGALDEARQAPLALDSDPLCRGQVYRTDTERCHLLLIAHHLVCDGWSGDLLLQRLARAYVGNLENAANPATDQSFATYAWRAWRQRSSVNPDALDWWRSQLANSENSQLWIWQGREHAPWPHAVAQSNLVLPPELCARCEAAAARAGVSPFIVYQTACKLALWRLSGEACQVLAIPCAVRSHADERAIGCFVDLHLSVSRLEAYADSRQLLQNEAASFRHGRAAALPLPALSTELKPVRLPDGNPWSSVLFAFQNYPHFATHWPQLDCRVERLPAAHSQFALKLELLRETGGWRLCTEYAIALFDAERLSRLESGLLVSLEQLAD